MKPCALLLLLLGITWAGHAQTLDPTFQPPTLLNQTNSARVLALVPLLSGQLLLSGTYTSLSGRAVTQPLQRLNADGSFDQELMLPPVPLTFLPAPSFPTKLVSINYGSLFPQPTGQVYAVVVAKSLSCGACDLPTPSYQPYLCRILAANTLDPSFAAPLAIRSISPILGTRVWQVLAYPTGDILVAFQGGPGAAPRLLKLQASGAGNTTFFPSAFMPAESLLDQVLALGDGGTLVSYHLASGESQLVRLLPDGSFDPSFTLGASPALPAGATFSATLLQPDGKLLVTGSFTSFAGVAAPTGTVRLNPTGTVDTSFQPPASLAPLVPLSCLPDGRLLVQANSQPGTASLRRLLPDGSADPSSASLAVTKAGYPVTSWRVVLQPTDGKPVLYGDFEAVNGTPRIGLARLSAAAPLASRSASGADLFLSLYPNPAHGSVTLESGTALAPGSEVQLLDCLGREVRRQLVPVQIKQLALPLVGLPPGLYLIRSGATTKQLFVE